MSEPKAGTAAPRSRMLVIDDEKRICTALERLFSGPFEVTALRSGQAAMELLARDQAFDVLLCDLMMHPGSGMELYAWIGANQPALEPRILFITGGGVTPAAREFISQQEQRTMLKPFDVPALVARVQQIVGTGRSGR